MSNADQGRGDSLSARLKHPKPANLMRVARRAGAVVVACATVVAACRNWGAGQ